MSVKYLKLSDLPIKEEINSTDLFIYSKEDSTTHEFNTKTISYPGIFNAVKTSFTSLNRQFKPKGEWNFIDTNANGLFVKKDKITELSSVVSYEYAKENFIDEYLMLLSAQLYGGKIKGEEVARKLPSYVGQIIISHNTSSQASLKSVYGQDTIWELIPGRFLFGAGPNEKNTTDKFGECKAGTVNLIVGRAGGQNVVKIPQIPKHSHKFAGVNFNKFPEISFAFGLGTEDTFECITADSKWVAYGRHHAKGFYLKQYTPDMTFGGKNVSKTFSFTAHGKINENSSKEKAHENMPPFVTEYIWERKL